MNAIGMHITTATGPAHGQRPRRVGDAPVHEPDEARRVRPGLDRAVADPGAVARVKCYGVYPWVELDANNAETETPTGSRSRARSGRRVARAAEERDDHPQGRHRPASCCRSRCRRPATSRCSCSASTRTTRTSTSAATRRSRARPGRRTRSTPYAGIKSAIQAINPAAQVDYHARLHRHGHERRQLLHDDRPGGRDRRGGLRLRDRLRRHGLDGVGGTTGTEDRDRTSLALPGQQGQLISQVAAVEPEHDRA